MSCKITKRSCWLIIVIFLASGCASTRHAVPPDLLKSARVFGMQDIRAFSGIASDFLQKDFVELLEQEQKDKPASFDFKASQTYSIIAISGGAADGAYGAGLLSGWSQSGTRPIFKVVTGISTGAIIAPFAFLGSHYDGKLKEFYTKYSTKDIVKIRPSRNSLVSTLPLERLIEQYINVELLKEIAVEHRKGRRLYVGTTNLDAGLLVIWDMGKIASVGDGKALKLFRKLILASASMPIVFPPVYLEVEANDKMYDEMHVDGGVARQVFFLYDVVQGIEDAAKEKGLNVSRINYAIYVIKNGYVDPPYKEISNKLSEITSRTVKTMINAQGIGDLYRLYIFTKNNKSDFNLAYIPSTYISKAKEFLDPIEMRALFDLGFNEALQGYSWKKVPPGLEIE